MHDTSESSSSIPKISISQKATPLTCEERGHQHRPTGRWLHYTHKVPLPPPTSWGQFRWAAESFCSPSVPRHGSGGWGWEHSATDTVPLLIHNTPCDTVPLPIHNTLCDTLPLLARNTLCDTEPLLIHNTLCDTAPAEQLQCLINCPGPRGQRIWIMRRLWAWASVSTH